MGTRLWEPKLVYQSSKQPEYIVAGKQIADEQSTKNNTVDRQNLHSFNVIYNLSNGICSVSILHFNACVCYYKRMIGIKIFITIIVLSIYTTLKTVFNHWGDRDITKGKKLNSKYNLEKYFLYCLLGNLFPVYLFFFSSIFWTHSCFSTG